MLDLIKNRRSVRKFTGNPVEEKEIHDLLEAAMNAPSAVNEQAWQFVVITGTILQEFLSINLNSPGSSVGILVCQDLTLEKSKGYSVQDCSAAVQNILLAAYSKGLGAVWTAVFPDNAKKIKKLLKLPYHVIPFAFVPIGHADSKPEVKNRFDPSRVHRNVW